MSFVPSNEIEIELRSMKQVLEALKRNQRAFANSFQHLSHKERTKIIQEVERGQKMLLHFLEKAKNSETVNSGTKFGIENLKQSLQSLQKTWRKTLQHLDEAGAGTSTVKIPSQDAKAAALKSYEEMLKKLGHPAGPQQMADFQNKLNDAYTKVMSQTGKKDLTIQVTAEDGMVKVRISPK